MRINWLFYTILTINCIVIGTFSNLIILLLFPFKNKNSTMANYFLRMQATVDFLFCCIILPGFLTVNYFGVRYLFICQFISYFVQIISTMSFITNLFLGIERWMCIYKPHLLNKNFTIVLTILCVIFCGFAPLRPILDYKSVLKTTDDSQLTENKTEIYICIRDDDSQFIQDVAILSYCQIISFIIIILIYCHVFIYFFKRNTNSTDLNESSKKFSQLRVALMLFGTTLIFILCWLPYLVAIIFKKRLELTIQRLYMINNSTNFFIYLLFHKAFQKICKKAFCGKLNKVSIDSGSVN